MQECEDHISVSWEEACSFGTLNEGPRPDPLTMFDDVFREMPDHLRRQREQLAKERG